MTSQLIEQRVRNRIIEMLEWLIESENSPPDVGMDELINSWEDWVPSPVVAGSYPMPVFTAKSHRQQAGSHKSQSKSIASRLAPTQKTSSSRT